MFLEEIVAHKEREIEERKRLFPLERVRVKAEGTSPPRNFVGAIRHSRRSPALVAEIKIASPSRGSLCSPEKAGSLPAIYADGGAACLSVVTEGKFFGGDDGLISKAKNGASLPVLRKDFVLDEYQIWESRLLGADAVLLIAACLKGGRLLALREAAREAGLPALVEVHTAEEVEAALACEPDMIGINNRDLSTFRVSLETTLRLRPLIPDLTTVVSESGYQGRRDVVEAENAGVDAILVGEKLVTAESPLEAIRELYGDDTFEQRQ